MSERQLSDFLNALDPPRIGDPSEYVIEQCLGTIRLMLPPLAGRDRLIIAYVKNAYPDRKDGVLFKRWPDQYGVIKINTYDMYWGCSYIIRVIGTEEDRVVENTQIEVRSQRSFEEQQTLTNNVMKLIEKGDDNSMEITNIYRDIDFAHYPELIGPDNKLRGTLKPRERKTSGHPTNIGFNRGPMIYCNTSNRKSYSYYGPHRVILSPHLIFGKNTVMYLIDIHCYSTCTGAHYITIKTVERGSPAQAELQKLGAMELDIANNPFLTYDAQKNELKCCMRLRLRRGQAKADPVIVEVMVADKELPLENAQVQSADVVVDRENHAPRANAKCDLCFAIGEIPDSIFA